MRFGTTRPALTALAILAALALGAGSTAKVSAQSPFTFGYPNYFSPFMGGSFANSYPFMSNYSSFYSAYNPLYSTNASFYGPGTRPYPIYASPTYVTSPYVAPSYTYATTAPSSYAAPVTYSTSSTYASSTTYGYVASTVTVGASATLGAYLQDGRGMTLYTLSSDTSGSGLSTCYDTCASIWPPALAQGGSVSAQSSITGTFAAIIRSDGSEQLTYNGEPLYFYSHDTAAGQTNGQGVTDASGTWSVATP